MKIIIYLIIIFPLIVYAQDKCSEENAPEVLVKKIDDVVKASIPKCSKDEHYFLQDPLKEYQEYFPQGEKEVNSEINGVSLKGTKEQLKILKKLLGNPVPPDWKEKSSGCETPICVVTKLLNSSEAAYRVFNIYKRNGYPIQLGPINDHSSWIESHQYFSENEIRRIDLAFKKMPPELNHLKGLEQYKRMPDGALIHGIAVTAAAYATRSYGSFPGEIIFRDPTFNLDNHWIELVTVHETCHHYDFQGEYKTGVASSYRSDFGFRQLSGWKKVVGDSGKVKWESDDGAKFVTGYAKTQPVEDFAETCTYYVIDPDVLKKKAPDKYEFMKKNVFRGKEFPPYKYSYWDEINELLEDGEICSKFVSSCIEGLGIDRDCRFTMTTKVSCGGISTSWMLNVNEFLDSNCFKDSKRQLAVEVAFNLKDEDDFCYQGGLQEIENTFKEGLCLNTVKLMETVCRKTKTEKLNELKKECVENDDYSRECLIEKMLADKNFELGKLDDGLARDVLREMPGTTISISPLIDKWGAGNIFLNCISSFTNMNVRNTSYSSNGNTISKKEIFYSPPGQENVLTTLDISRDSLGSSFSAHPCSKTVSDLGKKDGLKLSSSSSDLSAQVSQMEKNKDYKEAFKEFFDEVVFKQEQISENCKKKLRKSKCRLDELTKLIKPWWEKHGKGDLSEEDLLKIRDVFYK